MYMLTMRQLVSSHVKDPYQYSRLNLQYDHVRVSRIVYLKDAIGSEK